MSTSLAAAAAHVIGSAPAYCESGPITPATTAACAKVGVNINVAHAGYSVGSSGAPFFFVIALALVVLVLLVRRAGKSRSWIPSTS